MWRISLPSLRDPQARPDSRPHSRVPPVDGLVAGVERAGALAASETWIAQSGALAIHAFDQTETTLGQGACRRSRYFAAALAASTRLRTWSSRLPWAYRASVCARPRTLPRRAGDRRRRHGAPRARNRLRDRHDVRQHTPAALVR